MRHDDRCTRREALGTGLAAALTLTAASRPTSGAAPPASFRLVVKETAGLRRFSYPVHTLLPGGISGPRFRLTRDGRPIPAQFRAVVAGDGRPALALDFTSSIGPLETERYVVEAGPDVEPGPEPKRGLELESGEGSFRIQSGSSLVYTVSDRLCGSLVGVRNAALEFLKADPGGFIVRGRDGRELPVQSGGIGGGRLKGTVTRQGSLAIGLRFQGMVTVPGAEPVGSTLDLNFPSSKSWVETAWTVEDPQGAVAALAVSVPLNVEGSTVLVDLGTPATVYGVLRGSEQMTLTAGRAPASTIPERPWLIEKGPPGKLTTFAESPDPFAPPPDGWAHVMDSSRCTALAIAGFGRQGRDQIAIDSGGQVQLERVFTPAGAVPVRGPKTLRFWLHFVPMPVHVGAATSPQAMLAPLDVAWESAPG
jgi:hypothetical protein